MNVGNSMLPLLNSMKKKKKKLHSNTNWGRKMKTTPASLEFSSTEKEVKALKRQKGR